MCQCHTMWQSEGAMQVQVAHSKKIPPDKKNSYMGCQLFFRGVPPEGGGDTENSRDFFPPPPPMDAPVPFNKYVSVYGSICFVNNTGRPPTHGSMPYRDTVQRS